MNKYLKFKELKMDVKTATVALLTSVEERETQKGSPYCTLTLSDGDTQISANVWNTTKDSLKVEEKTVIAVELYPKLYKDAISYEAYHMGPAPAGCNVEDFVIKAPYDPEQMYERILQTLKKNIPQDGSPNLVALVEDIYEENKEQILYWSAAKTVHHNCYAGWLYHTYRMLCAGSVLAKVYPSVDTEVLLCGIALHDIGKLKELETDRLGIADYTVDGTLFGHALIGIEMINQAAMDEFHEYNPEKIRMLKHVLASHHGQLDWGAVTVPATPEAMMIHEIDMIDSRIYQFENAYNELEPGEMSDKIFGLGTRVYKPLI